MEQADRNKILRNIEKLIQYTDYDELMRQCIERKLIFQEMREQIEVILNIFLSASTNSDHSMLFLERIICFCFHANAIVGLSR